MASPIGSGTDPHRAGGALRFNQARSRALQRPTYLPTYMLLAVFVAAQTLYVTNAAHPCGFHSRGGKLRVSSKPIE